MYSYFLQPDIILMQLKMVECRGNQSALIYKTLRISVSWSCSNKMPWVEKFLGV